MQKRWWVITKEVILILSSLATIYGVLSMSISGNLFTINLSAVTDETKGAILSGLYWYLWLMIVWFLMRRAFINLKKRYNLDNSSSNSVIELVGKRYLNILENHITVIGLLLSPLACPTTSSIWFIFLIIGIVINNKIIGMIQPYWYEDMSLLDFEVVNDEKHFPPLSK